jgi:hypothetical protein
MKGERTRLGPLRATVQLLYDLNVNEKLLASHLHRSAMNS